jgi:hypothetical protein
MINYNVGCSLQDHHGIGTHDLDHPVSCRSKKTPSFGAPRRGICSVLFLWMLPTETTRPMLA